MTYLMARSNLDLYAFVQEKDKTMEFSKTIVVYDIKDLDAVNKNEYMRL